MTFNIRRAEEFDVPWLYEELKQFDTLFGAKKSLVPSDEAVAKQSILNLVDKLIFLIVEDESKQVGFVAAHLAPHLFNPEIMVLTEMFWWVTPSRRGSRAGAMLYSALMEIGEREADWVIMSLESASPVDPEMLEKRGFVQKERSFLLEVR